MVPFNGQCSKKVYHHNFYSLQAVFFLLRPSCPLSCRGAEHNIEKHWLKHTIFHTLCFLKSSFASPNVCFSKSFAFSNFFASSNLLNLSLYLEAGICIWIQIRFLVKVGRGSGSAANKNQNPVLLPDPHQGDKSNPDQHQRDADPQHWIVLSFTAGPLEVF
jgi:hypothetical protein